MALKMSVCSLVAVGVASSCRINRMISSRFRRMLSFSAGVIPLSDLNLRD
jgi:hypothetical protein